MVVVEVDNGPGIHVGEAGIEFKGTGGVFYNVNRGTGGEVAGALEVVFARSSDEGDSDDRENDGEKIEEEGEDLGLGGFVETGFELREGTGEVGVVKDEAVVEVVI